MKNIAHEPKENNGDGIDINRLLTGGLENDLAVVEMNSDSDYAKSFGIDKGDTLFLGRVRTVEENDLIVRIIDGRHELDTYNEFDPLDKDVLGVLVGVLKQFKDSTYFDELDDVLSAEYLEP